MIELGNKYGFINSGGQVVVEPSFDAFLSSYFSEGLCPFEDGDKCGFINESGEIKISAVFDSVANFSNGLAPACVSGNWGYIDSNGQVAIPFDYSDACCFADDGLATIESNGKWGYIDLQGNLLISPQFDEAYDFDGELAKIVVDDKFGYISRGGKIIWMQS